VHATTVGALLDLAGGGGGSGSSGGAHCKLATAELALRRLEKPLQEAGKLYLRVQKQ